MDNSKARPAANRKLPPDAVIRAAYYGEGLSIREIALRHGVDENTIHNHFSRHGWSRRQRAAAIVAKKCLCATADKVITKRTGFAHGRSTTLTEYAVSLPRVPTIHGHFAGA